MGYLLEEMFMIGENLRKKLIPLGVVILWVLFHGAVFPQARNCDFWGTATIRGTPVSSGDQIKAYDAGNQLCGTAWYVGGGQYSIHVTGDDPGTEDVDEGASEGDAIRFKINGETASVVGGSNVWHNNGSYQCNIEIPMAPPVADAGGSYNGTEGSAVSFDGSGSLYASTYSWTFGDGGTGSGESPSHVYAEDGTYPVTLTVENGAGTDTDNTTANISNADPSIQSMNANPSTVNEGQSVAFTGSATDPGGANDPLSYSWNFGDGGTGSGTSTSHTYADDDGDDQYTVRLTVSDDDGGTTFQEITVTVHNVAPTIQQMNANPQTINEGQTVNFSANATDPGGANDPLSYSWNFGDGGTGSGASTSHTYTDDDQYTVTLTVSDGDGGTDVETRTVTVQNVNPTANAGGPYSAIVDRPIQFNGSGSDPGDDDVLTYTWDLDNDGQYDDYTGRYPSKTYTSTGTYTVSLRVTDDDGGSDTDDATVQVTEGTQVTVSASPGSNMQVKVDGQTYTSPVTLYLIPGRSYELEAPSTQPAGSGRRYVFNRWSDNKARVHSITVSSSPASYEAEYRLQYRLEIDTGGKGGNPQGEGWYNAGSWATISIDTVVLGSYGTTRYLFDGWEGDGYTGSDVSPTFRMDSPVTQRVNWRPEYLLQVYPIHGPDPWEDWYAPGTDVPISVPSVVEAGSVTRYAFQAWTGTYESTDNPFTVRMDGPVEEAAVWQTQYFVDVVSDSGYGNPSGEGWYDLGATATVKIDTVVQSGEDTRVRFLRWEGVGAGSYTGVADSFQVEITGPVTETARWRVQYYLTVVSESDRGNPQGEGWYDGGTLVSFSVDSTVSVGQGVRYRFAGWTGTGSGQYSGDQLAPSILLKGPVEEVADWALQYYVAVQVDPSEGGTVTPFSTPGG